MICSTFLLPVWPLPLHDYVTAAGNCGQWSIMHMNIGEAQINLWFPCFFCFPQPKHLQTKANTQHQPWKWWSAKKNLMESTKKPIWNHDSWVHQQILVNQKQPKSVQTRSKAQCFYLTGWWTPRQAIQSKGIPKLQAMPVSRKQELTQHWCTWQGLISKDGKGIRESTFS